MPTASPPPLDLSADLLDAAAAVESVAVRGGAEDGRAAEAAARRRRREVIFETGYGPSGLPHIGTFGEVARTTMVRTAFRLLTEDTVPTRLICFSDDMDGLRKVPGNVPNQEMMRAHLDKPLTSVPDPFSNEYPSFGAANNARLRAFLDRFGFAYEFVSATETYKAGRFDAMLLKMLAVYDEVMAIMLPSLARGAPADPIRPSCRSRPTSGAVLQVPILERNVDAGTIVFRDPDNGDKLTEVPVTGGSVKCQWKADWALRWAALGIDYEMSGKDLIEFGQAVEPHLHACSAPSRRTGFNYELFLDENGQKISKSKGNGLTIDEWLAYASPESLSLFMFQKPRAAKRLYFDVIPKAVDEYFTFLDAYPRQADDQRLGNPVWHIHSGKPPAIDMPITFSHAAQPRQRLQRPRQGRAVGLHPAPREGRDAGDAIRSSTSWSAMRCATTTTSSRRRRCSVRPTRSSARRSTALDAKLGDARRRRRGRGDPARRARRRARHPALPGRGRAKGPTAGPGVSVAWFSTLYQILLGQERGPALRFLRGDLRHRRDAGADRQGAGRRARRLDSLRRRRAVGGRCLAAPDAAPGAERLASPPCDSRRWRGRSAAPSPATSSHRPISLVPTRQGAVTSATIARRPGNSTRRRGRAGTCAANRAPCGRTATTPPSASGQVASTGGGSTPATWMVLLAALEGRRVGRLGQEEAPPARLRAAAPAAVRRVPAVR